MFAEYNSLAKMGTILAQVRGGTTIPIEEWGGLTSVLDPFFVLRLWVPVEWNFSCWILRL